MSEICYQNLPEAIQALLRAGFTCQVVEHIMNHIPGVYVTPTRVYNNRRLLIERGEYAADRRRKMFRSPEMILGTNASISRYSTAMALYCQSAPHNDYIEPYPLVMAYRAVAAQTQSYAPSAPTIDLNDLYAVARGWLDGEVFFRHCTACHTWSLLALDSPFYGAYCPYCGDDSIRTGATRFVDDVQA